MRPARISSGEIVVLKVGSPLWSYKENENEEENIRGMFTVIKEIMCIVIEWRRNCGLYVILSDSGELYFSSCDPLYWKIP